MSGVDREVTMDEGGRVLLVCGPAQGGMRRHLEALAGGLPGHGISVAVSAPESVRLATSVSRFCLELGDRLRPLPDLWAAHSLRRTVREWRPSLVHAHGVKAGLLALAALSASRLPVVVTLHNLWHGGPLTGLLRRLLPRAAATIAVSGAVRERLRDHGIQHRTMTVIPNGLNLADFPTVPASVHGQPFTIAFLGRLTEEKGVPVLLEAVESLKEVSSVQWLVAGDGPLRANIEAAAQRADSRLRYLGYQENVLPLYHASDLVVMPSLSEGHPMTALEAMACGLPVVASRVGGLPE